jgi:cellulose synthase/poly-beta-1,6-N-acetylglucosamine synthase-like glycosyltransferase
VISPASPLAWMAAVGVLVLISAYGIGAPAVLLQTALAIARRRRLRYRPLDDAVLATSRFTIPVTLILPLSADVPDPAAVVRRLLAFRYPELELIVIASDVPATLMTLRTALDLRPGELFYRRSLPTGPIGTIYRSQAEPRLLVVEKPAASVGDNLNCAVNLARYRYVCVVDGASSYEPDALVEAMQAALEDPSLVVGVTTGLTVTPIESVSATLDGQHPTGLMTAARYLAAARTRLLTIGRRRLDLPPGGCPGFTIWRRDSVVDVGGFASDLRAVHADMTFRLHRHHGGDRHRYRVIHVTEPVGAIEPAEARERMIAAGHVPFRVLWRHRGLMFNPRLGRLGLFDFPRYVFNLVIAPWIELAALVLMAAAVPLGVITGGQLLLVLFIIALGSGIIATSALLLSSDPARDTRPAALFNLILVGPVEYFLTRPALLWSRLSGH